MRRLRSSVLLGVVAIAALAQTASEKPSVDVLRVAHGDAAAGALAAGGAVVFPTAQVFELTPICPHTLSHRSLIIPHTATVEVRVISQKPATILSADGQVISELSAGDLLRIRRSRRSVRLMHLAGSSFCDTLRRKLNF